MSQKYKYYLPQKTLTKKEKIVSVANTILPWLMYYDYLLPYKYWNKKKSEIFFITNEDYQKSQQIALKQYKDLHEKVFKQLLKQL